jgi:hypothetical protein
MEIMENKELYVLSSKRDVSFLKSNKDLRKKLEFQEDIYSIKLSPDEKFLYVAT